jgi:hypothetical protein
MKLVPPSLLWSSYVPSSFGLYCSACFGILFCPSSVRVLVTFSGTVLFPLLCSLLPFVNGTLRRHFGEKMNKETKLRIHNIPAKAALKFGSEVWVLKKREAQHLEAAQMKFFETLIWNNKIR